MERLLRNALLILGLAAILIYNLRRYLFGWLLDAGAPHYRVQATQGLGVLTHDRLTLATDHYQPRRTGSYPTVLIRSPYGRNASCGVFGFLLEFFAYRFAERGYHVIVQDTRGRFDSEGEFDPYFNEKRDGLATVAWLRRQPWFNGVIATWGPSYLGIVQWTIAADTPEIKAMLPAVTASQLHDIVFPDGAFDLGLALRWLTIFRIMDRRRGRPLLGLVGPLAEIRRGLAQYAQIIRSLRWALMINPHENLVLASVPILRDVEELVAESFVEAPLHEADTRTLGEKIDFYRKWLDHTDPNDPLWLAANEEPRLAEIEAPIHLVGGWYDFFLRGMLDDYATLRAAGHRPYLTIGPWYHFSRGMLMVDGFSEGLNWFEAQLKGRREHLRDLPVRIYVMGAHEWRELPDWPPAAQPTRYYLHKAHQLAPIRPVLPESCSTYRYDPRDPTPALAGAQFNPAGGPVDNRPLEARPDVLTFTTPVLMDDIEIIGPVCLELYVSSSLEHTDFFGRLCDVHPNGRSVNLCDGLFRITPGEGQPQPDGSLRIEISLWATAHRFKAGHAIRLQVSSGAHPHWTRNPGTGDLDTRPEAMLAAQQTIYHDSKHPSALVLPVTH